MGFIFYQIVMPIIIILLFVFILVLQGLRTKKITRPKRKIVKMVSEEECETKWLK